MKNLLKFLGNNLAAIVVIIVAIMITLFVIFGTRAEDGTYTFDGNAAKFSDSQKETLCKASEELDRGVADFLGVNVPQDAGSGCEPTDIAQMGTSVYYGMDISSPAAFYNNANGKGFNEGYGLQCVAGFKQFMFALSGKYVATKTGGASGYAQQQAQIEPLGFKWHRGSSGLQDGDWGIFGGGQYGHVAMYYQGKWFGQNQGAANPNTGNAFNLLSISSSNLIGYYRPNIYVKTSAGGGSNSGSAGNPAPTAPAVSSNEYTVRKGDTLGGISLNQGWWSGTAGLYGDDGYAQRLAEKNGIENRGVIYPNQNIKKAE